jgi:hypothetical protein
MLNAVEFRSLVSDAFAAADVSTIIAAGREAKAEGDNFLTGYAAAAYRVLTDGPAIEAKPAVTKPLSVGFYTVSFADGEYVTIRVQEDFRDNPDANCRVVGYLSGPDNTSSYTGFAFVVNGQIRTWRKWSGKLARQHEAVSVLMGAESIKKFGKAYAQISGNCYVCGRTLTTPESLAAGIGPICAEKGI